MRPTPIAFALLLLSALAPAAHARKMLTNGGIPYLTYLQRNPDLILVAGTISKIDYPNAPRLNATAPAAITIDEIDPAFDLNFQVDSTLFGDSQPKSIIVHAPFLEWPADLLELKTGVACILVLRKEDRGLTLYTVLPAAGTKFEHTKDPATLVTTLAEHLLSQLAAEKEPIRQWHLLRQLGPALSKDQSKKIEPFLDSKNPWVKRAALASITWATMDPQRIAQADQDIADFAVQNKKNETVDPFGKGGAYAPWPLLSSAYFFLNCNISQEDDEKKAPMLSLFRHIAANTQIPPYVRWQNGYTLLCRIGTADDAPAIWDAYTTRDEAFRKENFHFASNRQALLLALSRIYDLKLSNWSEEQFVIEEPKQAALVRRTLIDRKVIRE